MGLNVSLFSLHLAIARAEIELRAISYLDWRQRAYQNLQNKFWGKLRCGTIVVDRK